MEPKDDIDNITSEFLKYLDRYTSSSGTLHKLKRNQWDIKFISQMDKLKKLKELVGRRKMSPDGLKDLNWVDDKMARLNESITYLTKDDMIDCNKIWKKYA